MAKRPPVPTHAYIAFGTPQHHAAEILLAAAQQGSTVYWTVKPTAERGDAVVFYMTAPVMAFVAYGTVLGPSDQTWQGKACKDVGGIRLLPVPVSLARAKAALKAAWLNAPQGFSRRPPVDVARLLKLGDAV
jgi:hypothetical protein